MPSNTNEVTRSSMLASQNVLYFQCHKNQKNDRPRSCGKLYRRYRAVLKLHIDPLSPQNLKISPEFPDFELRSPELSEKSGISWFLHGKSPGWTGIALKWAKMTLFISICVKFVCTELSLEKQVCRMAHLSAESHGS